MLHLSHHIEYLLRYHECVIVPGIGAFLSSTIPGRIDAATGRLIPASKEVCFNVSIKNDDGLLTHSISRRENISFEQAKTLLAVEVDSMLSALQADGELLIAQIGTLSMDEEGAITFTPYEKIRPWMPSIEDALVADASQEDDSVRVQNYFVFRIPKKVLRFAAIFAFVLFCSLSLSIPSNDQQHKTYNASVLPISLKLNDKSNETAEPVSESINDNQTDSLENSHRYFLIVGASHSSKKCDQFISFHSDFELEIINSGATRKLIYLASSDSKEDLQAMMNDADVLAEFGQTWIYDAEK